MVSVVHTAGIRSHSASRTKKSRARNQWRVAFLFFPPPFFSPFFLERLPIRERKSSVAKVGEHLRLERHFEEEWIDRRVDWRDTVGVEQLLFGEVMISLIVHAVWEVRQIWLIVG